MGQRHGKQAKLTPLESKAKKSKSRRSVAEAPAAGANDDPAASATGNFVITIRMLTMNSNEANSTVAGNDRDRDAAKGNEIVDQSQVESSNQSATLQSSSSSSSWSGGRQESGSRAVCDSRKYSSATATCANCCTPVSIGSSSLADKISNMLSSRCKLGSISSSNGCQCADVAGQVASVDPPPSGTTGAGGKGKSKKSNWSLGKLTGRSKRDKKKDSPSCSSDDGIDLNVSSASTSSSNSDKTDSRGDETAAASSSRRTSDITTASSSSGEFLSLNGSSVVAPNPVRFPPNASISILNGTSSTSGSGATTTAAAFILPEMLTTANAGPAFIQHSNVIGHFESTPATLFGSLSNGTSGGNFILVSPFLDLARSLHPDEYSLEDYDEQARWRRALQIAEGIPAPPGAVPSSSSQQAPPQSSAIGNPIWQTLVCHPSDVASFQTLMSQLRLSNFINPDDLPRVHSTADYIHCLVPGLEKITSSCFYWGKMDRFEAEKLLEGKPEGTFLLRDSAQEEFLFSVSFRKYERSLHARIEQFNHEFSFDSHDPGVYTASTVTGLLEHYKDPSCVMFFEPMLTLPLHRNFVFSLQELARATIVSHTSYDGIDKLDVPRVMKSYLKSYHYKQRVHYKRFDEHVESS